ncbi:hypothetical protein BDN72DRAFT_41144 [Pluteus cervinus]|uniref:Uncharacterized protein n=1 Tax=Pluteus cervinus TaxID=181527 RepID=A0ACD3BHS9_9AGAR|nr:hypothetical protein BDN72DRAFT_41144 [Pluteus cervinus]
MPLVKCMWYNDEGEPMSGGCRLHNCSFVHPTSPDFGRAIRRTLAKPPRRASGGSSSSSFPLDWDTSSWPLSGSNNAPLRPRTLPNKPRDITKRDVPRASSPGYGHHATTTSAPVAGPSYSGWGNETAGGKTSTDRSGWGATGSSGWGQTTTDSSSSGWGQSTMDSSGWGQSTTDNSGWGQSAATDSPGWGQATTTSSSWGDASTMPAFKRKGKEKAKELAPSTKPVEIDAFWTAAAATLKRPEPVVVDSTPKDFQPSPARSSSDLPPESSKRPILAVVPEPWPLEGPIHDTTPLTTPVIPFANPPTDWSKIQTVKSVEGSMKGSTSGREQSSGDPADLLPSQIFGFQIFNLQRLVRYQLEAASTKREMERWKRTQASTAYSRTHLWARRTLTEIQTINSSRHNEATAKVEDMKKRMMKLPQLSPAEGYTHMEIRRIQDELSRYNAEVADWVQDLQLHRRIPVTPAPEPEIVQESPWEQLKSQISDLEAQLDTASEDLYSQRYTHVLDIEGPIDNLFAQYVPLETEESRPSELVVIKTRIDQAGGVLDAQTQLANELLQKIHNNEQVLVTLRAEREEQKKAKQHVEAALAQFHARQEEDQKEIERLRQEVKKLAESPPPSRRQDELNLNEIIPILCTHIVDEFVQSLIPALNALTQQCGNYNQEVSEMLNKRILPLIQQSDAIQQHLHTAAQPGS